MNKTIENKLLHFFTSGNIYEDFAEARAKKTAKLRRVIRACFYIHCAAAAISIALAATMHTGAGIIAVSVGEVLLTALAFMSVGDMMLLKTLLYCGDIVFAAAMFVTGALNKTKTPFYAVGAISVAAALCALAAFFAAGFKFYLEDFSPLSLRREHYTLLPGFGSEQSDNIPDMPDETETVLPPAKTEMQELADRLKEILCKPKAEKPQTKETRTEQAEEQVSDQPGLLPQTEVLQ